MRYLSVCSGIEAATAAWHPLGWKPAAFSEIEAFPRAVLKHHYPDVPLHGDFTTIEADQYGPIDLLVGGTPCQSFSIAGLRGGLDDERGNLALEFLKLAQRTRPRWVVWENVPGVLSSNGGRDFGSILGGLVELGYGFAYRVLDAQYFGCAIPRPRVFVVGHSRDWRLPAAVLFERESFAHCQPRTRRRPRPHTLSVQNTGSRNGRGNIIQEADGLRGMSITETERALGFPDGYTNLSQKSPFTSAKAGDEPCDSLQPYTGTSGRDDGPADRKVRHLRRGNEAASDQPLPSDGISQGYPLPPLQHQTPDRGGHGMGNACMGISRRPRKLANIPRYKALGNSMAVPVMEWIGKRIQMVEEIA